LSKKVDRGMFFPYINGRYINPWDGSKASKKYRSLYNEEDISSSSGNDRKGKVISKEVQ
jgi:hypothetical protein